MPMVTLTDPASPDLQEHEAEALPQRWPMSLEVRSALIKTALGLAGLEMTDAGAVRPSEGAAKLKPRDRLAAMRILATYDRLSIQERKVDLLENPSGEKPEPPYVETREVSAAVAEQALMLLNSAKARPAPKRAAEPEIGWKEKANLKLAAKVLRQRWPISMEIRGQIIAAALCLCGFTVTSEGKVEPIEPTDDTPKPKTRIVLAALRVLAAYDRLSLEERRVELRFKPSESPNEYEPDIDPDILAKLHELAENDNRRIKEERRLGLRP